MDEPIYQLPPRRTGTAWFGLTGPQVGLIGAGAVAVVVGVAAGSAAGILAGLTVAVCLLAAAVVPVGGLALYQLVPTALGYGLRRLAGGLRWDQRVPYTTAGGPAPPPGGRTRAGRAGAPVMPPPLSRLEIIGVERPAWAHGGRGLAPCGLVIDRHAGATSVVLDARSRAFTLLTDADQHRRIAAWARVLAQFGREAGIVRLGWTLRTIPTPTNPRDPASAVGRHDLRVWISVDSRRLRRSRIDPADAALAAAGAFVDRCRDAGLAADGPLSPLELAAAVRAHADPTSVAPPPTGRLSLAERAGLRTVPPVLAAPLAMRARWDAVQIDGAWHRTFWIAGWPTLGLRPGWLDPLLSDLAATRTLTVVMEPISARTSRRRINTEAVATDTQIQLRDRHAFRIPGHLAQAHDGIDQREAELHAGFGEYAYLGLLDLAAPDPDTLDEATAQIADHAARTGITDLRPLHGRHDLAWAATLPLGRAPARALVGGG